MGNVSPRNDVTATPRRRGRNKNRNRPIRYKDWTSVTISYPPMPAHLVPGENVSSPDLLDQYHNFCVRILGDVARLLTMLDHQLKHAKRSAG